MDPIPMAPQHPSAEPAVEWGYCFVAEFPTNVGDGHHWFVEEIRLVPYPVHLIPVVIGSYVFVNQESQFRW